MLFPPLPTLRVLCRRRLEARASFGGASCLCVPDKSAMIRPSFSTWPNPSGFGHYRIEEGLLTKFLDTSAMASQVPLKFYAKAKAGANGILGCNYALASRSIKMVKGRLK